ncbi:MAG TPA: cyclic nucleotide-binding domain-containing protein [Gaiellaceae bacterium]|nr:cyclic nucleotide-binding domain-containing protein [Gaiellaceae bacterium]
MSGPPKHEQIRQVFAGLPEDELTALTTWMTELEVDEGATLVARDDYGTTLYCITAGEAEVTTEPGEPAVLLGPGDTFGEIGLLLTGQRTATVRARTPMRLLALSGHDFDRIQAHLPELEQALRRISRER